MNRGASPGGKAFFGSVVDITVLTNMKVPITWSKNIDSVLMTSLAFGHVANKQVTLSFLLSMKGCNVSA